MYDDNYATEAVAIDDRAGMMREWIDLDNKVQELERQAAENEKRLKELRPKRSKLGQKIADTVYPQDVPMKASSTEPDW